MCLKTPSNHPLYQTSFYLALRIKNLVTTPVGRYLVTHKGPESHQVLAGLNRTKLAIWACSVLTSSWLNLGLSREPSDSCQAMRQDNLNGSPASTRNDLMPMLLLPLFQVGRGYVYKAFPFLKKLRFCIQPVSGIYDTDPVHTHPSPKGHLSGTKQHTP